MAKDDAKILGIIPAGLIHRKIISHNNSFEFVCVPEYHQRCCPKCSSAHCVIKDSGREQSFRHIECGRKGTFITVLRLRFCCRDCHSTFYEPLPVLVHQRTSICI